MEAMKQVQIGIPSPKHLWRSAAVKVRAFVEGKSAEQVCNELYPNDEVTPFIMRAAAAPAKLNTSSWAGSLGALSVSEAVQETVSLSMLGYLVRSGALRIDLGRFGSVVVPGRSTSIADAGQWIDEGAPIPARQYTLLGPSLRPHKLSVIVTFTREMSMAANIEEILRALIIEATGPAIDAAVLSTSAATSKQPAGLLYGLTPLTPAAGASAFDNCASDLGALMGDIASRNGGAHTVFAGNPAPAVTIRFYSGDTFPVGSSAALPAKTVVAIEPSSFATIIGAPEFEVGTVATIHQEDTAPADIGSPPGASGPNVVAAPVKSMFQVDAIALKMTLWGDWCMRAPHVAYMDNIAW
jgi:Phage capsid family